ncbi:hypothetical protein [Chondromyces crocatus]|uniref:Lipoprotein n=1 Tax=Chondromyces crocatus TaxID=52 RepID=A0A0K1ETC7_CHOCO|nr:hypothetical protein [Chondromyces crocatus]AKT43907.1 uncharacterized protein CMC5_081440 [Chondromyces crocatus]
MRIPRHLPLALSTLAFLGAGCAQRGVKTANVMVVPVGETVRIDLGVDDERDPPSCEIFGPQVLATVDGIPMKVVVRGAPAKPRVISGIQLEATGQRCSIASFRIEGLKPLADAATTQIDVTDGERVLVVKAINVRAARWLKVEPSSVAPGEWVTLHLGPEGDPPLTWHPALEVSIYGPERRVAVVTGKDLHLRGRAVSFQMPSLPSGAYRVGPQFGGGKRPVITCEGAANCTVEVVSAPDPVGITVHTSTEIAPSAAGP